MPSNPVIILTELDRLLSQPVELNIFGASALNLGYSGDLGEKTRDVDLIIPKKHINFLFREGRFSDEFLLQLYERAQLPDIQEIREIFSSLKDWVRSENDRI